MAVSFTCDRCKRNEEQVYIGDVRLVRTRVAQPREQLHALDADEINQLGSWHLCDECEKVIKDFIATTVKTHKTALPMEGHSPD